ncbi:hypothetical protein BG006_003465, partial [Podila minutissima]
VVVSPEVTMAALRQLIRDAAEENEFDIDLATMSIGFRTLGQSGCGSTRTTLN